MVERFEVIESKAWKNNAGRFVSIYGCAPFRTESERIEDGWEIVVRGWTIRDNREGTVGIGRPPAATREEAEAWKARLDSLVVRRTA